MKHEEAMQILQMYKDEIRQRIDKANAPEVKDVYQWQMDGFDMAINALQQTAWIPCSERLPLVGGEFLVTLVDNDGTWVSTAQWNMTFGGRWQDIFPNDGYRDISNVIAWKTLPIPYREDGEV